MTCLRAVAHRARPWAEDVAGMCGLLAIWAALAFSPLLEGPL